MNAPPFLSPNPEPTRPGPPAEGRAPNPRSPRRDQLHEVMRFFHYAPRTEEACWQWVVRYLRFHRRPGVPGAQAWRHPGRLLPEPGRG